MRYFKLRYIGVFYAAFSLSASAIAAPQQYKVLIVQLIQLEQELNKLAQDGWAVRAAFNSPQCTGYRSSNDGRAGAECQVVILEREK